jgi:putative hemolysin
LEGKIALVLEGSFSIRDLDSQYQLSLPREAGFETLAGFVLARLQKIPKPGESFDYDGHRFTVEEMEGHRIAKVRIEKMQTAAMGKAGD